MRLSLARSTITNRRPSAGCDKALLGARPPRVNPTREARLRYSASIVVLAGWLTFSTSGQAEELVNLGKLGDTYADASSVNAGRKLDNVFYGVPNLFDGGRHVVNNINYTYWLSDSATRHWLRLRFGAPVEIRSILIEFNAEESSPSGERRPSRRPEAFALDVTRPINGGKAVEKLPSVNVDGFRVIYPLEEPLADVVELLVVFPGPSMIAVAELEVTGIPSSRDSQGGEGPKVRHE